METRAIETVSAIKGVTGIASETKAMGALAIEEIEIVLAIEIVSVETGADLESRLMEKMEITIDRLMETIVRVGVDLKSPLMEMTGKEGVGLENRSVEVAAASEEVVAVEEAVLEDVAVIGAVLGVVLIRETVLVDSRMAHRITRRSPLISKEL